jgi:predicted nucleic acid-binding protein
MSVKPFLDTNILVYTADSRHPEKQLTARNILSHFVLNSRPVISMQVLQEFYTTAVKKLNIAQFEAKKLCHNFTMLKTVILDTHNLECAIDISIVSKISFWDAMIIEAAKTGGCDIVLSEDLNDGQTIAGVKIINPFANSDWKSNIGL